VSLTCGQISFVRTEEVEIDLITVDVPLFVEPIELKGQHKVTEELELDLNEYSINYINSGCPLKSLALKARKTTAENTDPEDLAASDVQELSEGSSD